MSLSIDMNVMFGYASQIFNALWPVAGIGAGLTLGVGIVGLVVKIVGSAVRGI